MKRLNQKLLCASLVMLVVVFGALCPGAESKRLLTDREMAAVMGSDTLCAQCIDICSDVGSSGNCDFQTCEVDVDENYCHAKYRETTTPGNSIKYCSTDDEAGEITCEYTGSLKSCNDLYMCWCQDSSGLCETEDMGDYSAKDMCD